MVPRKLDGPKVTLGPKGGVYFTHQPVVQRDADNVQVVFTRLVEGKRNFPVHIELTLNEAMKLASDLRGAIAKQEIEDATQAVTVAMNNLLKWL